MHTAITFLLMNLKEMEIACKTDSLEDLHILPFIQSEQKENLRKTRHREWLVILLIKAGAFTYKPCYSEIRYKFSQLVSAVWGVKKPAQVSDVRLPALEMFRNWTFLKARLIYDLTNLISHIVK